MHLMHPDAPHPTLALPTPLQPLATLLERLTHERDEATAKLYLLLETVRRLQGQQQQLLGYRDEYQARWGAQFRQRAAIEVVHSYQSFVTRLEQALQQLHGQIDDARAQAEAARSLLAQCEMRAASVRKLLERRLAEHQRDAEAREQKQHDELAAAAIWRNAGALAVPMNS